MNNTDDMMNDLWVCKSLNAPNHHFCISEQVDNAQNHISENKILFGQEVANVLNSIVNNCLHCRSISVEDNYEFISNESDIVVRVFTQRVNCLKDSIRELLSSCEEAKRNGKNRIMNYIDQKKFYPYYNKLKDLAYYATKMTKEFPSYVEKYLSNEDSLITRDYKAIIHKYPENRIFNGIEYEVYSVKDYEAFFALDLEELMFGTSKFPKYCTCSECGKSFVSNRRNCSYCSDCSKPELAKKRAINRKIAWRKDGINELSEKINNIYYQRIARAENHISTKYDSEETLNRLKAEKKAFMNKLDYYKKVVRNQIRPDETDTNYDPSIKTEDDLINWLDEVRAYLNNTKLDNHCNLIQTNTDVKEKYHAKDDEKEERDGIDYESER